MGNSPSQPFLNFEHVEENFRDMISSSADAETPLTFSDLVELVATQHINSSSDINGIFAWGVDDNGNIVYYTARGWEPRGLLPLRHFAALKVLRPITDVAFFLKDQLSCEARYIHSELFDCIDDLEGMLGLLMTSEDDGSLVMDPDKFDGPPDRLPLLLEECIGTVESRLRALGRGKPAFTKLRMLILAI